MGYERAMGATNWAQFAAQSGKAGGGQIEQPMTVRPSSTRPLSTNTTRPAVPVSGEAARRLANPTMLPVGSACGTSGVTRARTEYICPPGAMCQAMLSLPQGCVATGRWYNQSSAEYCCPGAATPPPPSVVIGSGDGAILAEMQRRRAMEQAALAQQRTSRSNTLLLLGAVSLGIGLFMLLRKK